MTVFSKLAALLAVAQFVLTPLLLLRGFIPALFSNILYAVALSYYHYLSFLGYSSLPFLEHTEVSPACAPAHVPRLPFAAHQDCKYADSCQLCSSLHGMGCAGRSCCVQLCALID